MKADPTRTRKRMAVLGRQLDALVAAGAYDGAAAWLDAFDAAESNALTLFIELVAADVDAPQVRAARQRLLARAPQRVRGLAQPQIPGLATESAT